MFRPILLLSLLFLQFAAPEAAQAEGPLATLQQIRSTGIIRIGYGESSGPFSYVDDQGAVLGYSIDICRRVVDLLREKIGLPAITIKFIPRSRNERTQLLRDGTIDMECAASTNSAERRKVVAFSSPHFFSATRFVARTSSNLHYIEDLAGRTVSSTTGSINIGLLNTENRVRGLNIAVVPQHSFQAGFDMVANGRIAAFVMDDVLLAYMVAKSDRPEDFEISRDAFTAPMAYGFMMRRGDDEFQAAVNSAIAQLYASGEFEGIYKKWFLNPIPPHGLTLNIPLSDELRHAVAATGN